MRSAVRSLGRARRSCAASGLEGLRRAQSGPQGRRARRAAKATLRGGASRLVTGRVVRIFRDDDARDEAGRDLPGECAGLAAERDHGGNGRAAQLEAGERGVDRVVVEADEGFAEGLVRGTAHGAVLRLRIEGGEGASYRAD